MKRPTASVSLPPPSTSTKNAPVAEVALLQRLPRGKHVFDFSTEAVPLTVAPGDLVYVQFRGRPAAGIIVRTKRETAVRTALQPVSKLEYAEFITPRQLVLAGRVSEHYAVNLGAALMLCCPVLPGKRTLFAETKITSAKRAQFKTSETVVHLEATAGRAAVAASLLTRVRQRARQALVLVPEAYLIPFWLHELRAFNPITFTSDLGEPEQRRVWQDIRTGGASVVVGTRAALFLPYANLGGIIVDYPEDESYKQQDQNPRYSGTEVVRWLAELHAASLALLSPAHSTETWQRVQNLRLPWRRVPASNHCNLTMVDLNNRQAGFGPKLISPELEHRIGTTLPKNERVLMYLNRRGDATSVLCDDCGYSPTCPTCKRPLAWHASRKLTVCFHCGIELPLPLPCPRCGGSRVRYRGAGLGELARETAQLFPNAKIALLEGEGAKVNPAAAANADIILGSSTALRALPTLAPQLCVMVSPDGELALPEWRAAEDVWATARLFVTSGAHELIVQTHLPEHRVCQSLAKRDINIFYEAELHERLPYHYPPHGQLVRFTAQASTEQDALADTRTLRRQLAPTLPPACELVGPYPDYYLKVRGRYRFHLLLRYPAGFDPARLWPNIPDAILIDRHPWNILH